MAIENPYSDYAKFDSSALKDFKPISKKESEKLAAHDKKYDAKIKKSLDALATQGKVAALSKIDANKFVIKKIKDVTNKDLEIEKLTLQLAKMEELGEANDGWAVKFAKENPQAYINGLAALEYAATPFVNKDAKQSAAVFIINGKTNAELNADKEDLKNKLLEKHFDKIIKLELMPSPEPEPDVEETAAPVPSPTLEPDVEETPTPEPGTYEYDYP